VQQQVTISLAKLKRESQNLVAAQKDLVGYNQQLVKTTRSQEAILENITELHASALAPHEITVPLKNDGL